MARWILSRRRLSRQESTRDPVGRRRERERGEASIAPFVGKSADTSRRCRPKNIRRGRIDDKQNHASTLRGERKSKAEISDLAVAEKGRREGAGPFERASGSSATRGSMDRGSGVARIDRRASIEGPTSGLAQARRHL
ncbi:hypothetical protein KM043_000367 [Ampulex compressa]|nr:hypothetical protein KM043_000367 [Ampulex compressa]